MTIYYAQGSAIVNEEEMFDRSVLNNLSDFYSKLSKGNEPRPISFSTGKLTVDNFLTGLEPKAGTTPIPFEPIGSGRPLTIMIREVYTGQYPKANLFGGGKDMLVTSAIKSIVSFDAKPLAINFLVNKVSSRSRLEHPPASTQGTPYIFYSPALLDRSLTLDLKIVFDTFPEEVFNQVGDIFNAAAGIPIFQVYGLYLLAAGVLTKIIGKAGEAIFDGAPVFNSSDALDIFLAGSAPFPHGFGLITDGNVDIIDKDFRSKYQVNSFGKVVDQRGNAYKGDIPYIVISVDGEPKDELKNFAPTAASAAVLSRFLGIKDGQQQPLNVLIDSIKLYNDLVYRKQIDLLDSQLKTLPEGDAKKALKEKRDALAENILEDILKPKAT